VLVIDETGFVKKGTKSAGVARVVVRLLFAKGALREASGKQQRGF
jgi:hypothetical protein